MKDGLTMLSPGRVTSLFAAATLPLALAAAVSATSAPAGVARASARVDGSPGRVVLPGTKPDFATSDNDQGKAPDSTAFDLHVYFGVPDAKALAERARAVSDPGSPRYRAYLTPDQLKAGYQITAAQRAAVDGWLNDAGLTATDLNWRYVEVKGTAATLAKAFGVEFHVYDEFGESEIGPNADLSVPASVGGAVVDVSGYMQNNGPGARGGLARMRFQPVTAGPSDAATCSPYWGAKPASSLPAAGGAIQAYSPCAYGPAQLRALYGFDTSGLTGKGQRVAVLTPPSPTLVEDVTTWSARNGLPPLRDGQLTVVAAPDGTGLSKPGSRPNPAFQDDTVNAEAVRALAPDADITAVALSFAANGLLADSVAMIEDRALATVVTVPLAVQITGADELLESQLYEQGALLGIGFLAASGDSGSLTYPAGNPWVTAVGGTAIAADKDGRRLFETGFADTGAALSGTSWGKAQLLNAAGGGRAEEFAQPWYQAGVVPAKIATGKDGTAKRVGADVAMDADPATGMVVGGKAFDATGAAYTQGYGTGTSQAVALFAAVQALAQQAAGVPIGFANPALYARYRSDELRDVLSFQDTAGHYPTTVSTSLKSAPLLVTVGGAAATDPAAGPGPAAVGGFDETTGLGVPTLGYLGSFRLTRSTPHPGTRGN
jgi:subtilase family serine protease